MAKIELSYMLGVCARGGRLLWEAVVAGGPVAPSPSVRLRAKTATVTVPVIAFLGIVEAYV